MAITPIEPRAAIAQYDSATRQYTLHVQTQGVHMVRRVLAQDVLKIPLENLRVITKDVGGSFGMKIYTYPEYALVLIASEKIGKPVKWTATRAESFVSDSHGRARIDFAQLGLDKNGRFTALQIDCYCRSWSLSVLCRTISCCGIRLFGDRAYLQYSTDSISL